MKTANSFRSCASLLRQQKVLMRTVALEQRRHYRFDDRYNLSKQGAGAGSKILSDDSVNPCLVERHYKSYYRFDEPHGETRRRITQDTADHQRRQVRIIEENKLKWKNRSEPRVKNTYNNVILARSNREPKKPKKCSSLAEKYSARRRYQRQKELERQARELRVSRKGYKVPKLEGAEGEIEAKQKPTYASRAWLEKQAREDEEKYWHTWQTCPSERRTEIAEEDSIEEQSSGYSRKQRSGLVKPPQNYDGSVRRYQTHSKRLSSLSASKLPSEYERVAKSPISRKPNGMEKQYLLAKDFVQLTKPFEGTELFTNLKLKRPKSLLRSHVFKPPITDYATEKEAEQLDDIELPDQPPRTKLTWQGLPRSVYTRFYGIQQAMQRQRNLPAAEILKKSVEPPRYRMTVKRRPTPMDSFSNQLNVSPRYLAYGEYGRPSFCEAWRDFTKAHNSKSDASVRITLCSKYL